MYMYMYMQVLQVTVYMNVCLWQQRLSHFKICCRRIFIHHLKICNVHAHVQIKKKHAIHTQLTCTCCGNEDCSVSKSVVALVDKSL